MGNIFSDKAYKSLLADLKLKIGQAQVRASVAVNQQLILLYWSIGNAIIENQNSKKWGAGVIPQLSKDLQKSFPDMKGFSERNLGYMRRFSETYPDFENLQVPLAKISWYHNITLLQKCPDQSERYWYAAKALEEGWSRNVMSIQIESQLHLRDGKAISNFKTTLPSPQSDMAEQALKDPYIFDFLTTTSKTKERDIERQLVEHITKFLLELGKGFAYVGKQYHLNTGENDYYLDLLFYHTKLHCYIVIELKNGKFKPEYAGKLNFYLSVVDDLVKTKEDNPTIGIILCKNEKGSGIDVEYALKDINKPMGVADFKLTDAIPENLKSSLPTIEEIENELNEEDFE
jgi:predicted nuclease of restriction endonuclease-like (RecB) superfamily